MLDVSKETHVGFLRAATKLLQEKVLLLESELAQVRALKLLENELCQKLSEELLTLRKRFFTPGGERIKSDPKKNPRRKAQNKLILHNQRPLGELPDQTLELESEEVISNLTLGERACECGCGELEPMQNAFESSSEIQVVQQRYIWRHNKRQKYKCNSCQKIVTTKRKEALKAGSEFSIHMAAQVADDKYHRHIPLNRQSEMMAERGLKVDTKTLYSITTHLGEFFSKIPKKILTEVKSQKHVHMDESRIDIFKPHQTGYVWSASNAHGVYYQYELTRSGKVAREILEDYSGIVMTDAYQGYDYLEKIPDITFVLCWSHVRRKFVDAMAKYPEAETVVELIDQLYSLEHQGENFESLAKIRNEKSRKIVDQIAAWIPAQKGKYLESLSLGKAIGYVENHWPRLTKFLDDPNIPFDNNAGERCQRTPVMGRNNFNGYRTINGADTAMLFYTLIETCKLLTVNPKAYLVEMALRGSRGEEVLTPFEYGKEIQKKVEASLASQLKEIAN